MIEAIDSLNPFIGVNDNAYIFYGLVYDYLTSVDQDMNIKPNLALSWNIVPTSDPAMIQSGEPYGSVWQYNLTHDATWHDGEPFDADDVVFTTNHTPDS
jgi:peptide/nickel transport system substrate-binding protein